MPPRARTTSPGSAARDPRGATRGGPFGPLLLRALGVLFLLGGVTLAWVRIAPPAQVDGAATLPHLQVIREDGTVLADLPLAPPASWEVRWNHSVTGVLVSDFYLFEGGRMVLVASHTPAFDAGLGQIPGRGTVTSDAHHGYWITGIDEPVPGNGYLLRVGSRAVDHRLVVAGRVVSLSALAEHQRVRVEVVTP